MSITRLQQARQMYAMGQRVAKTMDGSRPGYRGSDWGGSGYGDPSGSKGGSKGGGKGGDKDYNFRGPADLGVTTRSTNTVNAPDVDRGAVGQFSTYGRNTFAKNLTPPSVFSKIGSGIKDYITSGGLIGLGIKGLGNLFDSFTGPKPSEVGNLNMPGYNMLNIAGPVTTPTTPREGNGEDRNLYAATNQYSIPTAVEEEGITTLVNNPNFLQRFRVNNRLRQDKQGELDPQIIAMINNLYTTPTV